MFTPCWCAFITRTMCLLSQLSVVRVYRASFVLLFLHSRARSQNAYSTAQRVHNPLRSHHTRALSRSTNTVFTPRQSVFTVRTQIHAHTRMYVFTARIVICVHTRMYVFTARIVICGHTRMYVFTARIVICVALHLQTVLAARRNFDPSSLQP